jgi:hypothetical protein
MKLDVVHTFFTNSNGGSSVPVFARLHHSSFEPTLLLMVSFPVGLRQMPIVMNQTVCTPVGVEQAM